jgi:2-polyprenyl-6-hydroxyphenyl methylase / 3-demethylubiquinone-9 3-methyltransferase
MISLFRTLILFFILFLSYQLLPPTEYKNRLSKIPDSKVDNDFYDDINFSKTWYDSESWAQGLHLINPTRLKYIENLIKEKKIKHDSKILDLGCGGGLLLNKLGMNGFPNLFGIDPSSNSINVAKSKSIELGLNINYTSGDIYNLPYEVDSFELIILADVLDHLSDLKSAMKEIKRILKKGGILFFETIDRNFYSFLIIKLLAETFHFIPKNTHDYRLFVKPEELKKLFEEFDFKFVEHHGVDFQIGFKFSSWFPVGVSDSFLRDDVKHVYLGYGIKQ